MIRLLMAFDYPGLQDTHKHSMPQGESVCEEEDMCSFDKAQLLEDNCVFPELYRCACLGSRVSVGAFKRLLASDSAVSCCLAGCQLEQLFLSKNSGV